MATGQRPGLAEQHEHDGVNRLQRPVLPFLGLVDDGVGDPTDRFRRNVVVVDFLDVVLDIAGAHPLGIHGKYEFLETADILLAFPDDGRVELGFPVPRNINDDGTNLRGQLFLAVAVTAIAGIALRRLVAVVAEEAGHLGSHVPGLGVRLHYWRSAYVWPAWAVVWAAGAEYLVSLP